MRILDAFAGQGGATRGYQEAGHYVVAVDTSLAALLHNPADEIIVVDALAYIAHFGHQYDAIHASPPCQRYTHGNVVGTQALRHPDLVGPTRDALVATGRPYIIENVPRAPLRDPITLCGTMFELSTTDDDGTPLYLQRHRLFESNLPLHEPAHRHPVGVQWAGAYGGARRDKHQARLVRHGGYVPPRHILQNLMGIDWMTEAGMFEALPPVYTRWIGGLLPDLVDQRQAVAVAG